MSCNMFQVGQLSSVIREEKLPLESFDRMFAKLSASR